MNWKKNTRYCLRLDYTFTAFLLSCTGWNPEKTKAIILINRPVTSEIAVSNIVTSAIIFRKSIWEVMPDALVTLTLNIRDDLADIFMSKILLIICYQIYKLIWKPKFRLIKWENIYGSWAKWKIFEFILENFKNLTALRLDGIQSTGKNAHSVEYWFN